MQRQATRKKDLPAHVDPDRRFDTTSLTEASHGYRVHRDYAAHFFRWGFARNYIHQGVRVLEVGCGTDCPLVKVVSAGYADAIPSSYLGVDLNPLPKPPQRSWASYRGEFNFIKQHRELGKFDLIVNFEVIEHMYPTSGLAMLKAFREHLTPGGRVLLSTPVFDGKAAANHLHEYTVPELAGQIKKAGLEVVARYGTFANANAIKKVCTDQEKILMAELNAFYHHDVLSCFLAPKYPDASRNNCWVLRSTR